MVEKRTEKKSSSKARARLCVCAHTSCTVVGGWHSGLNFLQLSPKKIFVGILAKSQNYLFKKSFFFLPSQNFGNSIVLMLEWTIYIQTIQFILKIIIGAKTSSWYVSHEKFNPSDFLRDIACDQQLQFLTLGELIGM